MKIGDLWLRPTYINKHKQVLLIIGFENGREIIPGDTIKLVRYYNFDNKLTETSVAGYFVQVSSKLAG